MTDDSSTVHWLTAGIEMATDVPGFGPLVQAVMDERARRVSVALAMAESLTGRTREDLDIWARETPESLSLVARVLLAAGSSGNDRTLRILGGLLATAMESPGRSRSEQEIVVAALEGLTEEQLVVLAACGEEAQETHTVVEALTGRVSEAIVEPILIGLFSRGLMDSPYGRYGGSSWWELSAFGKAIHEAAIRVNEGLA